MWKRERDERNDWSVKRFDSGQPDWEWTKREHEYDATGRLVKSGYSQWWDAEEPPEPDYLEHTYAGSRHIQNYDGSSTYGERWQQPHAGPSRPGAGTPLNDPPTRAPQLLWVSHRRSDAKLVRRRGAALRVRPAHRRVLSEPECQRRERHLLGQGKALAKDSSGSGANWCTGIGSADPLGVLNPMSSRLDFDGTVTATDMDRATDAREKGRIGILGSALSYAGSSPRVTSEKIGRDVNPLGRGGGAALVGGQLNLGRIAPRLPQNKAAGGSGSSVNNQGQSGSCPVPECEGGGKYAYKFYTSGCFFWWLQNWSPELRMDEDICACNDRPCIVTRVDCGCSLEEWVEMPECCMCMACTCTLDLGKGNQALCERPECTPEWCEPPLECLCIKDDTPEGPPGPSDPPEDCCSKCERCLDACDNLPPFNGSVAALAPVIYVVLSRICDALTKAAPPWIQILCRALAAGAGILELLYSILPIIRRWCCRERCRDIFCFNEDCLDVIECPTCANFCYTGGFAPAAQICAAVGYPISS